MAKIQPDGRRQEGGPGVAGRVGDPLLEQKYTSFSNQKKPEKDFPFYKNRQKAEIALSVGVAATVTEAAGTPCSGSGPAKLLPGNPTQHLSVKLPWL